MYKSGQQRMTEKKILIKIKTTGMSKYCSSIHKLCNAHLCTLWIQLGLRLFDIKTFYDSGGHFFFLFLINI
jgi:hypothetical protein